MTTLFASHTAPLPQRCAGIFQPVNTYGGNVLKKFKELADRQLASAITNSASCFETCRQTTFAERANAAAKAAAIPPARPASTAATAELPVRSARHSGFGRVRSRLSF